MNLLQEDLRENTATRNYRRKPRHSRAFTIALFLALVALFYFGWRMV